MTDLIPLQARFFGIGSAFSLGNLLVLRNLGIIWVFLALPCTIFAFFFFTRDAPDSEETEYATNLWVGYLTTGVVVISVQWLFR